MTIANLEEARALLAEYDALPDLDSRLNWAGYERLPIHRIICICGHIYTYRIGLDDLRFRVKSGEFTLETHKDYCWGHEEEGEEEEEEEEDD